MSKVQKIVLRYATILGLESPHAPLCVVSEYLPKTSVFRNNPSRIFALPLPSKSSIKIK